MSVHGDIGIPKVDELGVKSWHGVKAGKYFLVDTPEKFVDFMEQAMKQAALAVDTETSGLDWVRARACGIVIGWGVENNYYLPIDHKDHVTGERLPNQLDIEGIRGPLNDLLGDTRCVKIFWNAKFDLHALKVIGIYVGGVVHDAMISWFLLDENADHSLKGTSKKFIDRTSDVWEKGIKAWRVAESKRRRSEMSATIKTQVEIYKADPKLVAEAHQWANQEIDAMDLSGLPPASVKRKKTTLITKAHSNMAKEKYKGHINTKNKLDQISYDLVPIDEMTPYACADVHYTWLLHMKFFHSLLEDKSLVGLYINEMQLCRMLFNMEQGGVKINRAYLEKIGPELYQEAHDAEQEVYKQVGYEFNVGSSQQLVAAIQSVGIKLTKYTKGSQEKLARGEITEKECTFAADAQVLDFLAAEHSFAKAVLDYRGALKIKSTYIEGILNRLDENDFIHSSFRQNVSTGRMSSKEPNLTNIPARDSRVKVAFEVPDDDHVFVFIDYSQVEVRIVAHYSQDPLLLSCYPFEGPGRDIHSLTGAEVILGVEYDVFLEMLHEKSDHKPDPHCTCNPCVATSARRIGKTVNFLIIYGGGGAVLQSQISTPDKFVSVDTCKGYINKYMRKYRGVKQWVKMTDNEVLSKKLVQNLFGRYRRFPDINHVDDKGKYRRLRQAANFLVQGTAADLFKYALVRVAKFIEGTGIRIVNVVHDDIQFYFPKNQLHLLKDVVNIMEDFQFTVPIIADVDVSTTTWAAKVAVDREMLEDFSYDTVEKLIAA